MKLRTRRRLQRAVNEVVVLGFQYEWVVWIGTLAVVIGWVYE